jgi:ankyrin repeat protein
MKTSKRLIIYILLIFIVIVGVYLLIDDNVADHARRKLSEMNIKPNGNALLEYAGKDAKVVKLLLAARVDPNITTSQIDKTSPLITAAFEGNPESVSLLLKAGANVNYKTQFGNSEDVTPLAAVTLGTSPRLCEDRDKLKEELDARTKIVQLLLRYGAESETPNYFDAVPITGASCGGMTMAVRALIDKGADVNRTSLNGETALFAATASGYLDTVKFLLSAGAEIDVQSKYGYTALMLAASLGYEEIVSELLNS